jgi:predicted permease
MTGQLLLIFINVVTPVFGLVLIAYVVGPKLKLEARTLSRASYYILMPAFVFDTIRQTNVDVDLAAKMVLYIFAVHVACALLGFTVAKLRGHLPEMVAAYVLIAVFGNIGNFGLSLIGFRLGPTGLALATVYFVVINITAFSIGVAAASWARGGKLNVIPSILKTPTVIAFMPALLFWTGELELPLFLSRMTSLLRDATIPVMLITLGVQLAEVGKPKLNLDVIVASGIRLLGGPVLAALLVIPFGLTGLARGAGILQASMPPAVLTAIIAIEYDVVPKFVTTTVLFGTLLSLVTLTLIMSLV